MLVSIFQMEGFATASAFTLDFKRGKPDISQALRIFQPDVVVWDIAIPYPENWAYFQRARDDEAARDIPFILTTTNLRALEELVGVSDAYELIGKPYDLDLVVAAVRAALNKPRESS